MIGNEFSVRFQQRRRQRGGRRVPAPPRPAGFTLVELLVVLGLLLILSAVGLPAVKKLLSDQKTSKAARNVAAFIDNARSRAVAENRFVGVRIERLGTDEYGITHSIRLRELTGVPPYSGDASDAVAILRSSAGVGGEVDRVFFAANDSPLVYVGAQLGDVPVSPVRPGDVVELVGGRNVTLQSLTPSATGATAEIDFTDGGRYPDALVTQSLAGGQPVKYRIHRRPVPSATKTLNLPRGVVIDLNASGIGPTGVDFRPATTQGGTTTGTNADIDLIFAPNGSVAGVAAGSVATFPMGQVFLCLGTTDGLPLFAGENAGPGFYDDLLARSDTFTVNVLNFDSIWLVINPSTGRVATSPVASTTVTGPLTDPTVTGYATAVRQTRSLASASATLDNAP